MSLLSGLKSNTDIELNQIEPLPPAPHPLSPGDCVVKGKTEKNVMLNLFQHLIESNNYETLK